MVNTVVGHNNSRNDNRNGYCDSRICVLLIWTMESYKRNSWEMTREMFKATNRPYVGIVGQDIVKDEDNKTFIITFLS